MINRISLISLVIALIVLLVPENSFAQQDPQYTHYMYNTLSVNPAYAGQREALSVVALHRSQWVGLAGAPETTSFSVHSPLKNNRLALGLNVVADVLGPATEAFVDANFAYTIPLGLNNTNLSFGVKAGLHDLSTDWTKGVFNRTDPTFQQNINQQSLIVGSGLFLSNRQWYVGVSVPNFFTTEHYDDFQESLAKERLHYYVTGGYVFDLSENTKFKPTFLTKITEGASPITDITANFLFYDKFTLGSAWRLGDSVSAMAGFQLTDGVFFGYGYDLTTSDINNYNSGTHEFILRFEMLRQNKTSSKRFF